MRYSPVTGKVFASKLEMKNMMMGYCSGSKNKHTCPHTQEGRLESLAH